MLNHRDQHLESLRRLFVSQSFGRFRLLVFQDSVVCC